MKTCWVLQPRRTSVNFFNYVLFNLPLTGQLVSQLHWLSHNNWNSGSVPRRAHKQSQHFWNGTKSVCERVFVHVREGENVLRLCTAHLPFYDTGNLFPHLWHYANTDAQSFPALITLSFFKWVFKGEMTDQMCLLSNQTRPFETDKERERDTCVCACMYFSKLAQIVLKIGDKSDATQTAVWHQTYSSWEKSWTRLDNPVTQRNILVCV